LITCTLYTSTEIIRTQVQVQTHVIDNIITLYCSSCLSLHFNSTSRQYYFRETHHKKTLSYANRLQNPAFDTSQR